jgi:hypothetical protein
LPSWLNFFFFFFGGGGGGGGITVVELKAMIMLTRQMLYHLSPTFLVGYF